MKYAFGLKVRLLLSFFLVSALASFSVFLLIGFFQYHPKSSLLISAVLLFLFVAWVLRLSQRLSSDIASLEIALFNLSDSNYSVSAPEPSLPEMRGVKKLMNKTFAELRQRRQSIYQKELLLDKVIESSPLALVLTNQDGHIIYSNSTARHLFNQGRGMEGYGFDSLLANQNKAFALAVAARSESLFQIAHKGQASAEQKSYHYSWGRFAMDQREHELHLFKELTREINRQEVAIWKKTIKVISHELNNSLAPISSLAHSSKILAEGEDKQRLKKVLSRIEDNVMSLHDFIQRYASFARLPLPNKQPLNWPMLIEQLRDHYEFQWQVPLPDWTCLVDHQQLQQALVNILKNAHEAGSAADDIVVCFSHEQGKTLIEVLDKGQGMSPGVMEQALVPFYSTKALGSGIGLALCQEIIEAHGGQLSLHNRPEGGLRVRIVLP